MIFYMIYFALSLIVPLVEFSKKKIKIKIILKKFD